MRNVVSQKFTKGINARLPIDRFDSDPQRLHTLQNARLSSRDGNTFFAKRIEGATAVNEKDYPIVLDILGYKNFVVVLYKQNEGSEFHYVDVVNVLNPSEVVIQESFTYSDKTSGDLGKLVLLEDTILIAPHNKMLNFIRGAWNFNDFVSTTPLIDANVINFDSVSEEINNYKSSIIIKSDVFAYQDQAQPSRAVLNIREVVFEDDFTLELIFKYSTTENPVLINLSFEGETFVGDVQTAIVNAINNDEDISTLWLTQGLGDSVFITSSATGTALNGLEFSVRPTTGIASEAYQSFLNNAFSLENPTDCTVVEQNKKCSETFFGKEEGSFGSFNIQLGEFITVTSKAFNTGELIDDIADDIFTKLSTLLEANGLYDVDVEDGTGDLEGYKIITITATNIGASSNLIPVSLIFNDLRFFDYETVIDNLGKDISEGDFDTTKAHWYTVRNVYYDGHKTKTSYPVYGKAENTSDNIELVIKPCKDIDGEYSDVEIFRKTDDSDFFFIKKITPQKTDPTKDYFVIDSDAAYRYIYTKPENFPTATNKTVSFKLGEYTTDLITLTPQDTEDTFITKIFDAFSELESFSSKWTIEISELPKGVVIKSKTASKDYNDDILVPTGSLVRDGFVGQIAIVTSTQTNVDEIGVSSVINYKLYKNDKLRVTSSTGDSQEVTVLVDVDIVVGNNLIPIKFPVDVITGSKVRFLSGESFSDFGIIISKDVEDPIIKFYDKGFRDFYVLDEKDYIWSKLHLTHEITRDRYVRANIEYKLIESSVEAGQFDFVEDDTEPQDNTSPFFSSATIYSQARYNDGTTSFYEEITTVETGTESESFAVKQNSVIDETIKEYAFYAQYKPKNNPFVVANASSFANANLPTEFSSKYKQTEDNILDYTRQPFNPTNPRFFVGFGRITRNYVTAGGGSSYIYRIPKASGFEWLLDEEDIAIEYNIAEEVTTDSATFPDKISVTYFGMTLDYVLESVNQNTGSYVLLPLLGLKTLIERLKLFYEIKDFDTNGGFGGVTKDQITNKRYRILGYELVRDTSAPFTENDGAVFIRVEGGTILDSIQTQITKKALGGAGDFDKDTHPFNLAFDNGSGPDYENATHPTITARIVGMSIQDLNVYGIDEKVDAAIYLGKKENEIDDEPVYLRTGYDTDSRLYLFDENDIYVYFSKLQIANIYATILLQSDVPYQKQFYYNQIIFSDPFILNSNANGYRNFQPSSFLNISPDYGQIVGIEYINNRLLVFTEHAVAVVNVGEVLTQQVGGQVFVDTSTFLNGYLLALKELPLIMPKTIQQYENMVFFCDGKDVWMYDGEFQNITQGAIQLIGLGFGDGDVVGSGVFMGSLDMFWGEENRYMGENGSAVGEGYVSLASSWVGTIDPENREYRITDSSTTYAFSVELKEWFGPYSYKDQGSDNLKNRMYSVIEGRLAQQNTGNGFIDTPFETVIESVANILDRPDMVKTWRKFYLNFSLSENQPSQYNNNFINFDSYGEINPASLDINKVVFGYKKNTFLPFENVDLGVAKVKNNSYHIGITNSQQNGEKLFWRITTSEPDFVLKMVSFEYLKRDRR